MDAQRVQHKNLISFERIIFLLSVGEGMTVAALPLLAVESGASYSETGFLMTGYAILYSVSAILSGRISDFLGRKIMFLISLTAATLSAIGYALASTFAWLLVFRMMEGLSRGMLNANSLAYIADNTVWENRARYTGRYSAAFGAGMASGCLIGGFLMHYVSTDIVFLFYPVFCLAVLLMAFVTIRDVTPKRPFAHPMTNTAPAPELFSEIKNIWPIAYLGFAYSGFLHTVWAFLSVFAQHFAIHLLGIGILFALFWCCRLVSFSFVLFLVARYRRKHLMMLGTCITTASAGIFVLENEFPFLVAAAILGGIGTGIMLPLCITYLGDLARKETLGFCTGFFELMAGVGIVIQTMLSGTLAHWWGIRFTYLLAFACLFVAIWIAAFCVKERAYSLHKKG